VALGQFPKSPLKLLFTAASADALDLLGNLLTYEPRRRISAKDVSSLVLSSVLHTDILTDITISKGSSSSIFFRITLSITSFQVTKNSSPDGSTRGSGREK
jgi:hypothetical protein